jgi:hypothetical protein
MLYSFLTPPYSISTENLNVEPLNPGVRMSPYEYIGNLHIHSRHSDGSGTTSDITNAAKTAGVDFIAMNDHAHLTRLHLEEEGYHKGILVLVGSEIGTRFHHYLAYGINDQIDDERLSPQEVIDAVAGQGGFGFIAHPFETGMPYMEKGIAYTWNDWSVKNFTGICIWNFTSRWKENVRSFWSALYHLIFKRYTLKGPSMKTLSTWDRLCRERRVAAIGGSDAHASTVKKGFISFTPLTYEYLLGTINTHVLLHDPLKGDSAQDKRAIYRSLQEGNSFLAHDGLAPAQGFRFSFIKDGGETSVEMGQEAEESNGLLMIVLPSHGLIRLIRNGALYKQGYGIKLAVHIWEKGVYRVEVLRKTALWGFRPWIFSNPIYLR